MLVAGEELVAAAIQAFGRDMQLEEISEYVLLRN